MKVKIHKDSGPGWLVTVTHPTMDYCFNGQWITARFEKKKDAKQAKWLLKKLIKGPQKAKELDPFKTVKWSWTGN